MIEIHEALRLIRERARQNEPECSPLGAAVGRLVSKSIISDTSSPPFDKALMDGYAVRSTEINAADAVLPITGLVAAGDATPPPLEPGSAVKIMTGASLPAGADAVVAREQTDESEHAVTIRSFPIKAELNLMRAGTICQAGDTVLDVGQSIRTAEVGVLAESGHESVWITPSASVAILATGNELVSVGQPIRPGQIRNSNGPMLVSMAQEIGCPVTDLGIARDDQVTLNELILRGLEHDVLLLSGGVSTGDFDLVPSVLRESGVTEVFHKVRLKPGKPIWFGASTSGSLVFGLPGNPVSSLVCFHLFVRPALLQIAGHTQADPLQRQAALQGNFRQAGDRTTYFPAQFARSTDGVVTIQVLPWHGSSDLHTFTRANSLAIFPAGQTEFNDGAQIEYLPIRLAQ